MFENIFCGRRLNEERLLNFGFYIKGDCFVYEHIMSGNLFRLYIFVFKNNHVETELVDLDTNEPYVLYKTNIVGTFISSIRSEIELLLQQISEKCFDCCVFKGKQTQQIIDYVQNTYGNDPEFLWSSNPGNAVWRRKDSRKWYGIIMTVTASKIGISLKEDIEIIDLRLQPEKIPLVIDNKCYFPGWHMNKRTWYTMVLNNSLATEEICKRIDISYELAKIN